MKILLNFRLEKKLILFSTLLITIIFVHKLVQILISNGYSNTTNSTRNLSQKLPDAIIIGAAKCGTSTLIEFISAHPNVAGIKNQERSYEEIHFFSYNKKYALGIDWYRSRMPFSNEKQITLEKSITYFTNENSPSRIHSFNPQIKLILMVCDPVKRAISGYLHRKEED